MLWISPVGCVSLNQEFPGHARQDHQRSFGVPRSATVAYRDWTFRNPWYTRQVEYYKHGVTSRVVPCRVKKAGPSKGARLIR